METLEIVAPDPRDRASQQRSSRTPSSKMQDLFFSIVIPTYNQADYLALALRSVREQTVQDYEVIVVNNHSTDHTARVLEEFEREDQRVRSITFSNNGVIGASRNMGIQASRGQCIAFLDSDDVWYTQKLERVAEVLHSNPDVGVVCHDEDRIQEGKIARRLRYGPTNGRHPDLYHYLLFEKNCLSTSATVVRKGILEEVGRFSEDPNFVTVEDYDLWLRLAPVTSVYFLHEALGQFRVHGASTSVTTKRNWQNMMTLLRTHLTAFETHPQANTRRRVRRRYASAWLATARGYAGMGQLNRSLAYFFKALRSSPLFWKLYPGLALMLLNRLRSIPRARSS